jgi:hypothetical protein
MNRPLALGIGAVALAVVVGGAVVAGNASSNPKPSGSGEAVVTAAPSSSTSGEPTTSPTPTVSPTPTAEPTPTPEPTPVRVADPLTGRMVTEAAANRRPIAVMIDDLGPARPQSGFNAASIVWQAPAEGGIPRYMMIFNSTIPGLVGPVRSSRFYYITWAAEWKALYGHVGGSPQAMSTLQQKGAGQYVFNADEFRWGGYYWRIKQRFAPHNMYTDGKHLRRLAAKVGAKDGPVKAHWQFAPDAPLEARPQGGTIVVTYPQNKITYRYDRASNTYLRSVTGEAKQIDKADGKRVAPKNVVIMNMIFGPLNDGHPNKHRLEANVVGTGKAWIATNGKTIKGTWSKKSNTAPTLFFDSAGKPVTLTVGQTFVQVLRVGQGYSAVIKDGKVPTAAPSPSASAPS